MLKTSRRQLARFLANELTAGKTPPARLAKLTAAYLIETKQLGTVEQLIGDVAGVLASEHGAVHAEVVSAQALTSALRDELQSYVKSVSKASSVEMDERVDESLLGGVVVRLPGQELDASLRKKLVNLTNV